MPRTRLRLVTPCSARGVTLEPHPSGGFCPSCREVVHDLRDATRAQVVALMKANGGRICGVARRGPDGEPRLADDLRPGRRSVRGAALALALAACDGGAQDETAAQASPEVTASRALEDDAPAPEDVAGSVEPAAPEVGEAKDDSDGATAAADCEEEPDVGGPAEESAEVERSRQRHPAAKATTTRIRPSRGDLTGGMVIGPDF